MSRKQLLTGVGILLGFVFLLLIFSLNSGPKASDYSGFDTDYIFDRNFAYISNDTLYAFNGLGFYAQDISSGSQRVLAAGKKYPQPRQIFWANDNGALVDFDSSFLKSAVYDELTSQGKNRFLNKEATWYIDFSNQGELTYIDQSPISYGLAAYDQVDTFYYVKGKSSTVEGQSATSTSADLIEFNISTKKSRKVTTLKNQVVSIASCGGSQTEICIVSIHQKGERDVFSLDSYLPDGSSKSYISEAEYIKETNSPSLFAVLDLEEPSEDLEFVSLTSESLQFFNVNNSSFTNPGDFRIEPSGIAIHFLNASEFIILGVDDRVDEEEMVYLEGSISENKVAVEQYHFNSQLSNALDGFILNNATAGVSENLFLTILNNSGQKQIFVSRKSSDLKDSLARREVSRSSFEACNKQVYAVETNEAENRIEVSILDNEKFNLQLKTYNRCLLENYSDASLDANFIFIGVDPKSGRRTTD